MQQVSNTAEGRDFRSLGYILLRRKWVLIVPTLVGLIAGIVIGHPKILPPVYRSSATLLLDIPEPVSRDLQGILSTNGVGEQMQRLQSLLQSNDFLLKVADATGLRNDAALSKWVEKSRKRYPDMSQAELQDLHLAQWLRSAIRLGRGRDAGENVVVVNVQDLYPDRARLIAQNLTNGVIEANKSAELERVRALHDFSLEQLAVYKERLTDAEKRLDDFRRGVVVGKLQAGVVDETNVKDVRMQRSEAASDLERISAERDVIRSSLSARAPNAAASLRSVSDTRWLSAVREVTAMESAFAQQSPATMGAAGGRPSGSDETTALLIARKIQELQPLAEAIVADPLKGIPADARPDAAKLLLSDLRVSAARARVDAFDSMLGTFNAAAVGTPREETTQKRLIDDVETNRALYNAFVQQLASSQISEAYSATKAAGRLTVLEPASRPLKPVKPNRFAFAAVGTVLGMLLGIGALSLVERNDITLRDVRDVERMLGLRVLGTIPQIEKVAAGRRDRGAWAGARLTAYLEDSPAYQELRRVSLELRNEEDTPVRSVLLTSARSGEGKTTASILLAAAAAHEERRVPVLLVDLDFRRGSVGRLLNMDDDSSGVVQALETRHIDEAAFRKTDIPNLHVLPLGRQPAPRNDLLTFESLSWFMPELTRRYGLVILDSPPNVPVPDALVIGQLVDAVLIVIKAGASSRHLIERGVELQKQFTGNVRGVLMNNVDEIMPYYYDYKHYGYPYGAKRG